jgi:hypothetical protein
MQIVAPKGPSEILSEKLGSMTEFSCDCWHRGRTNGRASDRALGIERDRATAAQKPSQVGVSREPTEAHSLLYCEAFAARAVREGVRVGHFKTAFLQVFAVIQH